MNRAPRPLSLVLALSLLVAASWPDRAGADPDAGSASVPVVAPGAASGAASGAPVSAAPAAAPAAVPGAVQIDGASVSADLRGEYLVGQQAVVPISVANLGEAPLSFPDLAARPWLVRFELTMPEGGLVRRSTAPPEQDSGRTVQIPIRGQRRTLLEIPGIEGTRPGSYPLAVQLVQGDQVTEIARQTVRFATPHPVAGDLGPSGLTGSKVGLQAVWVHQAAQGFDLYLLQASSEDPTQVTGARFLAHLDQAVEPMLAAARTAEATAPFVVWRQGERTLRILRIDNTGVVTTDRSVDAPWPHVSLIGRPGVAVGGVLGVPLWVPDPKGLAGELRVATIGPGNHIGFARISRFAGRPDQVETTVDASGAVQLLVRHAAGLDLYTLRGSSVAAASVALPLPGRRLAAAQDGLTLLSARFGVLPPSGDRPGGLAIFTLGRTSEGLQGRWLDLRGNAVAELAAVASPAAGELVEVVPNGDAAPGLLTRAGHSLTWTEGTARQALGSLEGTVDVVRDSQGRAVLRRFVAGGPVRAERLQPKPL